MCRFIRVRSRDDRVQESRQTGRQADGLSVEGELRSESKNAEGYQVKAGGTDRVVGGSGG